MAAMKVLVFVVAASIGLLNAQVMNSDLALAMMLGGNRNNGGTNMLHNLVMMNTLGDAGPALMLALQNQGLTGQIGSSTVAEAGPVRGDAKGPVRATQSSPGRNDVSGISPLLLALSGGDAMKKIAPLLLLQQNII